MLTALLYLLCFVTLHVTDLLCELLYFVKNMVSIIYISRARAVELYLCNN